jgi:DNA mismatch repair protein MutS
LEAFYPLRQRGNSRQRNRGRVAVKAMTPLMKQYWEIKSLHPDKILFFRMGDFYELFFEDAQTVAPLLGIALTSRNKKSQDETPMCGMPHHSVAPHLNKLLAKGFKLAICDQVEDPKTAKGLVKRAITRILTPGMVFDVDTLEGSRAHYLSSFDEQTLSFLDMSTGEAFWIDRSSSNFSDISQTYAKLSVAEVVLSTIQKSEFPLQLILSIHDSLSEPQQELPESARRLLSYVKELNSPEALKVLRPFEKREIKSRMKISATSARHLELFVNSKGEESGTLFACLDKTKTSAGARKLKSWMQFPLNNKKELESRWDLIDQWRNNLARLKNFRDQLGRLGDLERRLTKVAQPSGNARDLLALAQGVEIALGALKTAQVDFKENAELKNWSLKTREALTEDPPLLLKQGGLIRKGFSQELDEYIRLTTEAHTVLAELEAREKASTGISSLKVRYNNVFGYYIEVTHTHKDKVPDHYKRKQTLSTAERFYTEELMELEKKTLLAETKRNELEFEIFESLKKQALESAAPISWLANLVAELDVISALAWLALENRLVRPQISETGRLKLLASRHPVVENSVKTPFVPNDIVLEKHGCLLLTGPNMAGKSTLMRQVAVASIMAQIGSFVAATNAELPLFDQIFTRIGASDQLSEGLSTFMVEMTETAELLKDSTKNSLVILDEIGRGTSTYDGLSLAESILEFLLENEKGQVFFATHYHEITRLAEKYKNLVNAHMSVVERSGQIEFLHSLVLRPAGKSYGLHVARLAGVPSAVIRSAEAKLKNLEKKAAQNTSAYEQLGFEDVINDNENADLKALALQALTDKIKDYKLLEKSPFETLQEVQNWQKSIKEL